MVALLTTSTVAISTMSAIVVNKNKDSYYEVDGQLWLSEEEYNTYTYNKDLNDNGYYENIFGEIVSMDDLNMGDLVYVYATKPDKLLYKKNNGVIEGDVVLKTEKVQKSLNYVYNGDKIKKIER